jgi:hypothetical protein
MTAETAEYESPEIREFEQSEDTLRGWKEGVCQPE